MISHYHAARRELTAPGSPFAVAEIEVRGFPSKVFANAPLTMRQIWESTAAHADNTYLVYEDERYTYDEVAAQVRSLAHVLSSVHEVGLGDRVAIATRWTPIRVRWLCHICARSTLFPLRVSNESST
jgi:long-chain acyl-CoA synthetase